MNNELIELGRRAVACEGWRWMEGMKMMPYALNHGMSGFETGVVSRVDQTAIWICTPEWPDPDYEDEEWTTEPLPIEILKQGLGKHFSTHLPDLSDPATLGCLLALVREVLNEPKLYIAIHQSFCIASRPFGVLFGTEGPTEAHTLVATLESA